MKNLVSILLLINLSYAGECTKSEIMTMINKGFNKNDIDEICNKTLQNPHCCCHKEIETWQDPGGWESMRWMYDRTEYEWMSADQCSGSRKTGLGLFGGEKIRMSCGNKSQCGR